MKGYEFSGGALQWWMVDGGGKILDMYVGVNTRMYLKLFWRETSQKYVIRFL